MWFIFLRLRLLASGLFSGPQCFQAAGWKASPGSFGPLLAYLFFCPFPPLFISWLIKVLILWVLLAREIQLLLILRVLSTEAEPNFSKAQGFKLSFRRE